MEKKKIKGSQSIGDSKSYVPDGSLVSFLQEWLQIHQKRDKLTKEGENLSDDEKKRIRELDRMKVYHLDNTIFPAMANLVYFFEAMAASKTLADGFEDEVIELVSPGNVKSAARMSADGERMSSNQFRKNNLARLIIAILNTPRSKKPTPLSKYRISLMYQLQNIVGDEMDAMILKEYSYSQIWKSALDDYGRMKGWLALLARSTEDYKDKPNRSLGFLPIGISNNALVHKIEF